MIAAHPSASRNLVSRVLGLTLARVSVQLFSGISLILLARVLGPDQFGEFSLAWSVLLGFSGMAALGLPVFALRSAVLGRDTAVGFAIFLNLITSIVSAVIGFITLIVISSMSPLVLALLAAAVIFEKNAEVRVALGTEFGKAAVVNRLLFMRGFVGFVIFVCFYFAEVDFIFAFALSRFVMSMIVGVLLSHYVKGYHIVRTAPKDGTLESFRPMAFEVAVASLRNFDVAMVGLASGDYVAGLYSSVQKLIIPIAAFAGSASTVAMGPATRMSKRGLAIMLRRILLVSIAGVIVASVVSIFAAPLLTLILGDSFLGALGAFRWMLVALPAFAIVPVLSTILQAKGKARAVATVTIAVTIAAMVFIPAAARYSGAGLAAAVLAISMWLRLISLLAFAFTNLDLSKEL